MAWQHNGCYFKTFQNTAFKHGSYYSPNDFVPTSGNGWMDRSTKEQGQSQGGNDNREHSVLSLLHFVPVLRRFYPVMNQLAQLNILFQ